MPRNLVKLLLPIFVEICQAQTSVYIMKHLVIEGIVQFIIWLLKV